MNIEEFMATLCARTAIAYRSTLVYLNWWEKEKPQFPTFTEYLGSLELAPATRTKHIRHARTIAKKTDCWQEIAQEAPRCVSVPPPGKFTDTDFQSLYGAFYGVEYPKFIIAGQRHRYWHAAETKLGKRFHLHDLKRFSGELALLAGASPLELQQHMDHANLATTLAHYETHTNNAPDPAPGKRSPPAGGRG